MVFNLTSCARRKRLAAFSLAEYMVATSVGLLVLAASLVLWAYASRTCAMLYNYIDLSNASKVALDKISQQVRNAKSVQSCSANQLVLIIPEFGTTNLNTVSFGYDTSAKKLTQKIVKPNGTSSTTTLLTGCSNFQFTVSQRTPISNSFALYTNGFSTNTAKVIQMQWACSRRIRGDKSVMDNQISANVVIRNK